jgi:CRISPR/Cas system-associated protein endoribonuclease Cas2
MYNSIGLMTPRGSGTSGYVMKNLSHMKKVHNRDQFLKELQNMKVHLPTQCRIMSSKLVERRILRSSYMSSVGTSRSRNWS